MESPNELSLAEIRKYMLENGCKVTNHALVKHFKRFLTNPDTQNEARKQFKTYVNILATIKNENNQKYLILRKKYLIECPTEEMALRSEVPSSPGGISLGGVSLVSEGLASPFRQPPPYKPPPEVSSPSAAKLPVLQSESADNYRDCINEFAAAVRSMDSVSRPIDEPPPPPTGDGTKVEKVEDISEEMAKKSVSNVSAGLKRENSIESDNKENDARFSFSSGTSSMESGEKTASDAENPMSVKEATRKFNRMASEEEAKIISPPTKKKPEKVIEEKMTPEVTISHPKGKEWVVSSAKANYMELSKLASEYPELVKLQDPTTYTALHWAAKHGNDDVVKLIAGTYKADVHARTNGGYTPLHLAVQFGRENTFELLCNVYKANRDLMDWSGNKPLDYHKQRTSVSASTYSKIKARRKHPEKDSGFLRIGSLNVRVKKTTEAFSNFLGVGNGNGNTNANVTVPVSHPHHHHHRHHLHAGMTATNPMMRTITPLGMPTQLGSRASVPINMTNKFDKIHKSWGSADNLPRGGGNNGGKEMPPPKGGDSLKKRKSKRNNTAECDLASSGYSSMPTTPNQLRAPIGVLSEQATNANMGDSDSDLACGFGSSWSVGRSSLSSGSQSNSSVPRF